MSTLPQESAEIFLEEAGEQLQFLREYSGVLLDPCPVQEDLQRLYIAAHTLEGSSGLYGFHLFREVAGRLGHIYQYALNTNLATDAAGPLMEFVSEAVALLESDLLMVSETGAENVEEIDSFKQRYSFAFQTAAPNPPEESCFEGAVEHMQPEVVHAPDDTTASSGEPASVLPESAIPEEDFADLEPDGEVPAEILEFFVPEAEEQLLAAQQCLLKIENNPNPEDINRLFRAIHTVKGSAAQVGLQRIARVAHRAEDLLGKLRDGELQPTPEITDACLEAVDVLKHFVYSEWRDEEHAQSSTKSLLRRIARLVPEQRAENEVPATPAAPATSVSPAENAEDNVLEFPAETETFSEPVMRPPDSELQLLLSAAAIRQEAALTPGPVAQEDQDAEFIVGLSSKEPAAVPLSKSVRISLERLDGMMDAVGELVINRTRMLGRLGELESLADVLNFSKGRMSEKIENFQEKYEFGRLTAALAAPAHGRNDVGFSYGYDGGYFDQRRDSHSEFSELEMDRYDDFSILSRSLGEISADLTEVLAQLDGFVRKIDQDIDEFTKLAHRLQDEISGARMVRIGNLYTRLSRTLRDAAKASGKQVELKTEGAETELDNNIIQQISDPLIHLVRNAVAHGIESSEVRIAAGKPAQGTVTVCAVQRGNHIVIDVEDDGGGIDYDKVRRQAIAVGIINADDAERLTDADLSKVLFHPGFSTANRKTELAGRGVGLDVVKANVENLNGEVAVQTQLGVGTRFTLRVPLTLIISQALFFRCGKQMFAVPLSFVEEIRRLPVADIDDAEGLLSAPVRDAVMNIYRLDAQLGLPPMEPVGDAFRLVVVNTISGQVGLVVEEVLRKDEIVIKSLGEYMRNIKMYSGGTIAPDGSLILLLDVNRLISSPEEVRSLATRRGGSNDGTPEPIAAPKSIILADDSISVRKFVGRMLEKAGYSVRLACDGLEALELVSQHGCDLVITDIEMPRTTGYELMAHLRQDERTRNVPVMVVTSRAGAKHRDRAIKDGASAFLTKPVQEEQIVEAVQALIGEAVRL